ncbi:MAG: carboxylating nicotinate-nucleotide diphosphorylase [Nocardioides sp.]
MSASADRPADRPAPVPLSGLPEQLMAELIGCGLHPETVIRDIANAVAEDLPGGGVDVTSAATIAAEATAVGEFVAREPGTLAGLHVAAAVFHYVLGDRVSVRERLAEGSRVQPGEVIMRVDGPTRGLLTAERTALNFVSHLSGIATATARWVDALAGTSARVLDTRKTLPNYRALQKYAVRCGGGHNHRFSLTDAAMVKDNHVIAAGGVVQAYQSVRSAYPELPVIVEVTTLGQLQGLLDVGCQRMLLDNMSNDMMAEAVRLTAGRAILEASGGLTLARARSVAETGVDLISVGALTHSVRVFDIGLDLLDD